MDRKRVLILGAAGRDFHNFNVYFRNNPSYEVVAFTAAQIPRIEERIYPRELAGKLYPEGIPIKSEDILEEIIRRYSVDEAVFAYSDVSHEYLMHIGSRVMAAGADFKLMGPRSTQLRSKKPVISVCAVRTGCGKSQTSRYIARLLKNKGKKVGVIRHPMPYGDLAKQALQHFASFEDMERHHVTIEEREEYEPYVAMGMSIYAGVDYEAILRKAEEDSDVILWDGGNNDFSFIQSDYEITILDPHRPGHEMKYHPGELNLRRAKLLIINKVDTAMKEAIHEIEKTVEKVNPHALLLRCESEVKVDVPEKIKGKKVLVIEDGPTLTHGGMSYGAGIVAARRYEAQEVVNPEGYSFGSIKDAYQKYANLSGILPALGYFPEQLDELQKTIDNVPCDLVLIATPIDLAQIVPISKPTVRVFYELKEIEKPSLSSLMDGFLAEMTISKI